MSQEELNQLKLKLKLQIVEDIKKTFDAVKVLLAVGSPKLNMLIGLKRRYKDNVEAKMKNIILAENAGIEFSKIDDAFHYLIDELTIDDLKKEKQVGKQNPRFGIHHAYTCDRSGQNSSFIKLLVTKQEEEKCHFFYLYGDKAQEHKGLFRRFVSRLEGIDLDHKNKKVDVRKNTFEVELTFPALSDPESLMLEVPRKLMAGLQMNEEEMKKIGDKNLSSLIDHSPILKEMGEDDQVCVLITISQRRWDKDLIPEIARWFIQEFCCQKNETDSPLSDEMIAAKKRLTIGPEFFFFFAVTYKPDNNRIKEELDDALSEAKYTKTLFDELSQVEYGDLEDWFEEYESFWEDDDDGTDAVLEKYFGTDDSVKIDMKNVQRNLTKIINHINDSEKDAIRNS